MSNPATLDQLTSWGLGGFVGPDAGLAIRDDLAAARAGVDSFELGSLGNSFGASDASALRAAIDSGRISVKRFDDMYAGS